LPKPAPELDEAWNNLDWLPASSFEYLENLRSNIAASADFLEATKDNPDYRGLIDTLVSYCKSISEEAEALGSAIEPEIGKIRPKGDAASF